MPVHSAAIRIVEICNIKIIAAALLKAKFSHSLILMIDI